jgi:hypothetical protein
MTDWIKWDGGENPAGDALVEVQFRNGEIDHGENANGWNWGHGDSSGNYDIVAYRVVEEERETPDVKTKPIWETSLQAALTTCEHQMDAVADTLHEAYDELIDAYDYNWKNNIGVSDVNEAIKQINELAHRMIEVRVQIDAMKKEQE